MRKRKHNTNTRNYGKKQKHADVTISMEGLDLAKESIKYQKKTVRRSPRAPCRASPGARREAQRAPSPGRVARVQGGNSWANDGRKNSTGKKRVGPHTQNPKKSPKIPRRNEINKSTATASQIRSSCYNALGRLPSERPLHSVTSGVAFCTLSPVSLLDDRLCEGRIASSILCSVNTCLMYNWVECSCIHVNLFLKSK